MNCLTPIKLILTKRFIYAAVICICFMTASLVISRAQASSMYVSDNQTMIPPVIEPDEKGKSNDPDVTDHMDDQDLPSSDPPGTTDQNNSTGDEILLRPPR